MNRSFYDENSNLVRVDKENRDSNGIIIAGNPYFTTEYQLTFSTA
ncbi:MAG: hypothetical protein R3E58_05645 [Phycisphaerae bacterium]